jgi:hypothetical protein
VITGAFVEMACTSKACAPPPVGTGGSTPSASSASSPDEMYQRGLDLLHSGVERVTKLPPGPYSALDFYVNSGYLYMNRVLREGADVVKARPYFNPSMSPLLLAKATERHERDLDRAKRSLSNMDEAFEQASVVTDGPVLVHRGISDYRSIDEVLEQYVPGAVVSDKGFVSTSLSEWYSSSFASADSAPTSVRIHVTIPTGVKVLAGSIVESELILNRGTQMRVVGIRNRRRVNDMDTVDIDLEVIP